MYMKIETVIFFIMLKKCKNWIKLVGQDVSIKKRRDAFLPLEERSGRSNPPDNSASDPFRLNRNVWLNRRRSLEKDLRRGGGARSPPPFGASSITAVASPAGERSTTAVAATSSLSLSAVSTSSSTMSLSIDMVAAVFLKSLGIAAKNIGHTYSADR